MDTLNFKKLNELRENYIDSIMGNDKLMEPKEHLIIQTDTNGHYVRIVKRKGLFWVESSWRIPSKYATLEESKRLYVNLHIQLLAEQIEEPF